MSTLKVTNIQDTSGGNSLTTAQLYSGAAKAWVNFNGTGTVAIRASFNVSSITDNGTGDYTVNFTNAMVDANYSIVTSYGDDAGGWGFGFFIYGNGVAAGSCRLQSNSGSGGQLTDRTFHCVSIFR